MTFIFDLDDTLVFGDIIRDVSSKMVTEGLIDKTYSNADITHYDLRELPENVRERTKRAFADPEYVWIKRPIVGCFYFLYYLESSNHTTGIITSRPATILRETLRFLGARFSGIKFGAGIHFINTENHVDMENVIPAKADKLAELRPDFYFDDNADYCWQAHDLNIGTFLVSNKQTPWNHEAARLLKKTNHPVTVIRNVAFFPESRL